MIVADTNLIVSLWLPNKFQDLAYYVLEKDSNWVAPLLWRSELRNVMAQYLRKNILDVATVLQTMQEAENLMYEKSYTVNPADVIQLVLKSNCSAYDCEFVALADDIGVQLVTFDKQICREFPQIAVHPTEFIN